MKPLWFVNPQNFHFVQYIYYIFKINGAKKIMLNSKKVKRPNLLPILKTVYINHHTLIIFQHWDYFIIFTSCPFFREYICIHEN